MHCAVCVLRETLVVRDHANCGATLMQLSEQPHHRSTIARIEVASRLVGQQNRRPAGKRTRDCDALLLAARELAWQMFCPMRHAHALQSFGHKRFPVTRAHAAIGEWQFDILKNAEIADQIETLKNETDLAIADAGTLSEREIRDLITLQRIAAR